MARKKLIRTSEFYYHIYARSNNKEWFYLEQEIVWNIFIKLLNQSSEKFRANISIATLMNNHFHLLVQTPDTNIDTIMQFIMKEMAQQINKKAQRINHVFGSPYKWCVITTNHYLYNVFRYIYQNPLRANICTDMNDYRYYKIFNDHFVSEIKENEHFDKWLNTIPELQSNEFIKKSLYRREFRVGRDPITRKPYQFTAPYLSK